MKRLTDKVFDCMTDFCDAKDCVNYEADGCCSFERYRRLAAYEYTGLEPEDVSDLALKVKTLETIEAMYDGLGNPVHLREMVQAENDGRLAVLTKEDSEFLSALLSVARKWLSGFLRKKVRSDA